MVDILCHFVDGRLIEIRGLFCQQGIEGMLHISAIGVEISRDVIGHETIRFPIGHFLFAITVFR